MTKIKTEDFEFDLIDYLNSKGISYKTVGKNVMFACPFHHQESGLSFGINILTGKYNCFSGSCKAHGGLPGFIQKMEGLPSIDSAESWLRGGYGLSTDALNQPIQLNFGDVKKKENIVYIPEEILEQWDFRHPYLEGRGSQISGNASFVLGTTVRTEPSLYYGLTDSDAVLA